MAVAGTLMDAAAPVLTRLDEPIEVGVLVAELRPLSCVGVDELDSRDMLAPLPPALLTAKLANALLSKLEPTALFVTDATDCCRSRLVW